MAALVLSATVTSVPRAQQCPTDATCGTPVVEVGPSSGGETVALALSGPGGFTEAVGYRLAPRIQAP